MYITARIYSFIHTLRRILMIHIYLRIVDYPSFWPFLDYPSLYPRSMPITLKCCILHYCGIPDVSLPSFYGGRFHHI